MEIVCKEECRGLDKMATLLQFLPVDSESPFPFVWTVATSTTWVEIYESLRLWL